MFDRFKKKIKEAGQKFMADAKMSKEFKDIFEVGGVPAYNTFYYFGIFIWKYIYKGFYKPWHRFLYTTLADSKRKRNLE